MLTNFQFSENLRTIPPQKLEQSNLKIKNKCKICSTTNDFICDNCLIAQKLLQRYFEANIPVDFWFKSIKDFKGDESLIEIYNEINKDIKEYMTNGFSIFLKGRFGTGKTLMSSLLLKKIVQCGYNGLYTTLSDVVTIIVHGNNESKFNSFRELKMTDFLILDEFDPRFFKSNEASAELYGRILENIIRIRFQNYMPTILITNNSDPMKDIGSDLGAAITSLINGYTKTITVVGPDFRSTILNSKLKETK